MSNYSARSTADMSTAPVVAFPDVGQGASTVAVSEEASLVVDCPAGRHGAVLAELDRIGAQGPVSMLVVSHRDLDHAGGVSRILASRGADRVILNRGYALSPEARLSPNVKSVLQSIFDWLDQNPGRQGELTRHDSGSIGNIDWRVHWPTQGVLNSGTLGHATVNHTSIVLMLECDGRRFLITGDADDDVWRELLDRDEQLLADVLVIPHHGAALALLDRVLDAVDPQFCIVSVGRGNPYGHPRRGTLDAVAGRAGTRLMCTQVAKLCHSHDLDSPACAGDVRFTVAGGVITAEPAPAVHHVVIGALHSPRCQMPDEVTCPDCRVEQESVSS